jgi:hypothetical protein
MFFVFCGVAPPGLALFGAGKFEMSPQPSSVLAAQAPRFSPRNNYTLGTPGHPLAAAEAGAASLWRFNSPCPINGS